MRNITLIILVLIILGSCKTTQICCQNSLIIQKRNDGSVVSNDYLLFTQNAFKVPRGSDTTSALRGGVDSLGMMFYDSTHGVLYVRATAAGSTHKWEPQARATDLINYWTLSGSSLYPNLTAYNVGIGTASPTAKLDVVSGTGEMSFNGSRLIIQDHPTNKNLQIGDGAGENASSVSDIYIGSSSGINSSGAFNVGVGRASLSNADGNGNTAVGNGAGAMASQGLNTSMGFFANLTAWGRRNTVIGYEATTSIVTFSDTLSVSIIGTGTSTLTGSLISTYISNASLSVGDTMVFTMFFTGTPPSNISTDYIARKGRITSSNTITLLGQSVFPNQGTGTIGLSVYDKQSNSIAIGQGVATTASNEISIGNSEAVTLTVGSNFIVDLTDAATDNQVLTWDAGSGKASWESLGGGGGGVTSVSGTGAINVADGLADAIVSIDDASTSTKGAASFNASDFNVTAGAVTIDYANGQASSGSLKGFLSSTDWTTFNSKQATITGALTPYVTSNATASRAIVSDGSGKLSTATTTSTQVGYLSTTTSDVQTQLDGKLSTTATSGRIPVANGSNVLTAVAMSGDATISNAGVVTLASILSAGSCSDCILTFDAKGRILTAADGSGGGGSPGTVTIVTGTSPVVITSTPTTTPNVTINNAAADGSTKGAAWFSSNDFNDNGSGGISIDYTNGQPATTLVKGFLTAADWTTFNNKVSTTRTITAGTGLTGGGDLSANRTITLNSIAGFVVAGTNMTRTGSGTIADPYTFNSTASGSGSVTSFSFTNGGGFTGTVTNSTSTPTLSLVLQNSAADGTTKGQSTYTAADFNASSGLISIDYTNGQAATSAQKGFLTSTDWVTFNAKQDAVTGAATTVLSSNLTSNRVAISNGSGKLDVSSVTTTTLAFLDISSSLTTLLAAKEPVITYAFQTLTDGATITVNGNNGINFKVTLAGSRTVALSNITAGKTYLIEVNQDATGNRHLTLPANSLVLNGAGSGTSIVLSTSASAKDVLTMIFDGTNYIWGVSYNAQ